MPPTRRELVLLGGILALVAASVLLVRAKKPALPVLVVPAAVTLGILYWDERLRSWRDQRKRQRTAKGQCLRCGYDLTGNVSGVCPECGEVSA